MAPQQRFGETPQPPQGPPPRAGSPDPVTGQTRLPAATGRLPVLHAQKQPVDLVTRLDGQRGWLKELDEKLKKRSIIALVLTCLAVGVGASALYVALKVKSADTRITALQERVDSLEAATGGGPDAIGTVPETDPGTTLPETDGGTTIPETTVPDPNGSSTDPGTTTVPPAN